MFFFFTVLLFCCFGVGQAEVQYCQVGFEARGLGQFYHCRHFIIAVVHIVANKMWDIGLNMKCL